MSILIRGARVFTPEDIGVRDALVPGEKVTYQSSKTGPPKTAAQTVRADGLFLFPGLIDSHIHIIGGGGERGIFYPGFSSGDLLSCGITACVGMLGVDSEVKTIEAVYQKAQELCERGVPAKALSGSYTLPPASVHENYKQDIAQLPLCCGVGEVAYMDSRAPDITAGALAELAFSVATAGAKAAKTAVLVLHVGNTAQDLSVLLTVVGKVPGLARTVVATHINRSCALLDDAAAYIRLGGVVDVTAGILESEERSGSFLSAPYALAYLYESLGSLSGVTMSSDAGGSAPIYAQDGSISGSQRATPGALISDVFAAHIQYGIPLSEVLRTVTTTPMTLYGFEKNTGSVLADPSGKALRTFSSRV